MSNFLIAFVKCRASCCEEHFFRQIVFEERMRIKEYCAWQVKFQESLVISAAASISEKKGSSLRLQQLLFTIKNHYLFQDLEKELRLSIRTEFAFFTFRISGVYGWRICQLKRPFKMRVEDIVIEGKTEPLFKGSILPIY